MVFQEKHITWAGCFQHQLKCNVVNKFEEKSDKDMKERDALVAMEIEGGG